MANHEHEHDENCGCEEEEVFVVTDENGVDHEMIMVFTFEADEHAYAVLLDRNDPEADGIIFKLQEEGEEAYLVPIEDDAEWERVASIYEQLAAEENEG
ncbi:DUF1292 domain-containing protein [Paenibacillus thermoaerophilus]|uniref:UPF0473 protein ACFQWB_10695 n=1 Tax=Paenibacillus thermoaerophilus TaxID=1215385 RepID=A0ABW2V4N4_9BACL|nr:DUF1292 domain-containing protein [Paenibacillus thermoaerophilus]TMV18765.1 DUF1292 domain-containing protein [Paenibacillus thermoaerophilus]